MRFCTKLSTSAVERRETSSQSKTYTPFLDRLVGSDVSAEALPAPRAAHTPLVLVDAPRHADLGAALTYTSESPLAPGTLVRVPFGRRDVAGIVWDEAAGHPTDPGIELRSVTEALRALPPLDDHWRRLVDFAASYYQRSGGEIALSVLPPGEQRAEALPTILNLAIETLNNHNNLQKGGG